MEVALTVIIAVLAVCLAIVVARKRAEAIGALKSKVDEIALSQNNLRQNPTTFEVVLKGVETKAVESTGSVKESVLRDFGSRFYPQGDWP